MNLQGTSFAMHQKLFPAKAQEIPPGVFNWGREFPGLRQLLAAFQVFYILQLRRIARSPRFQITIDIQFVFEITPTSNL